MLQILPETTEGALACTNRGKVLFESKCLPLSRFLSGKWWDQDRKTNIYKEFVADGTAVLRPGIQRLIDEAQAISVSRPNVQYARAKDKDR